jgi:hypothetical protein
LTARPEKADTSGQAFHEAEVNTQQNNKEGNSMHLMYFTERPYPHVPKDKIIRNGRSWGLPNRFFDPVLGGQLYNRSYSA